MPALTTSPNPAPPSALTAVAGAGFPNAKTRLLLDGAGATTNIFRPRQDGTFNVGITVSATAKTQTLIAQQQVAGTWSEVARTSVVVQAVVVPPPPPPPPPPPGPVTTVPAGGDLQAALQAAPNGTALRATPGATYVLTQSLRADGKRGLTLDLTGATLRTNLPAGAVWPVQELVYARGWEDCVIKGGTLTGSHNAPGTYRQDGKEFQAGIGFVGGKNNRVEGTIVRNNMGDGFGVYGINGLPALNTTFLNCESHGNGRMGIAVVNARGVLWDGGQMSNQAWIAFEVEPDPNGTDKVTDVVFRNAVVSGQGKHLFAVSMIGGCERITCENMLVKAGPNRGIWSLIEPKNGARNKDITFRNNTGEQPFFEDPGWRAVLLAKDTDGLVVTGNRQPVLNGMPGVLVRNSPGAQISGNVFTGASAEWVNG